MYTDIQLDHYRFKGTFKVSLSTLILSRPFRKLYYYRKIKSTKGVIKLIYRVLNFIVSSNYSIELAPTVEIGKGCLFLHPHGITFNGKCKIGDNFTILKGATIGSVVGGGVKTQEYLL